MKLSLKNYEHQPKIWNAAGKSQTDGITSRSVPSIRRDDSTDHPLKPNHVHKERSFETERQAFALTEQHLKSSMMATQRKLMESTEELQSKRVGSAELPMEIATIRNQPPVLEYPMQNLATVMQELASAESEMSHLRTTNAALQATEKAMARELHLLKHDYETLRDQNESYEILLREKTMEGGMMFDDEPGGSVIGKMERIGEEEVSDESRQAMDGEHHDQAYEAVQLR